MQNMGGKKRLTAMDLLVVFTVDILAEPHHHSIVCTTRRSTLVRLYLALHKSFWLQQINLTNYIKITNDNQNAIHEDQQPWVWVVPQARSG